MPRRSVGGWIMWAMTGLAKASGFFASYICLAGMLLLIISDPIMRYIVGAPVYWSNEVSTFLMIEMALCGFGIALIKGKHVRVRLIFDRLPYRVQNILWVVLSFLTLCFLGILTYAVMKLAFSSLEYNVRTPTAELPYFPWQLVAGLGLAIFTVATLSFTVERISVALKMRKEAEEELAEASY